ncbi:MAG: glycosyltransferase, partial [Dactylosporangium sp.]|nr:glycosyltransferase [Dactylosporangium sp.]
TRYRNPGEIVNLLTDVPEIHVAFVGTASQTIVDEITSLAGSHGVAERLSFIPPVPLEQVTSAIADADVSVILYRSEGSRNLELAMPNKLFDSLAAGVPVVAPDGCAAGAFVAEQGLGRTFDIDTPGSLASAVRGVLQDPHLRSRVRARAAEFTWARAESTLLALVEELRNTGPEQDGQAPTAT